jgi:hypothetical protein
VRMRIVSLKEKNHLIIHMVHFKVSTMSNKSSKQGALFLGSPLWRQLIKSAVVPLDYSTTTRQQELNKY